MRAIALSLFVWQMAESPLVENAGVVQVYAIHTPTQVEVREFESIEVPIAVLSVVGDTAEGYCSVAAFLRYDGRFLEFKGARLGDAGGRISKPIDIDRDGAAGDSPLRRVSVTWSREGDTQSTGILCYLDFAVRALPSDSRGAVTTSIAWDSATVRDAAGTVIKSERAAPTSLLVRPERKVALVAPIWRRAT